MIILEPSNTYTAFETIGAQFIQQCTDIESWFRVQWLKTIIPFYASVDIRNAGFKCAPIDTNLFPGGFNNLSLDAGVHTVALQTSLESICPTAKIVGLIPENHTRNDFYLRNVATLVRMIRQAGFDVLIASLRDDIGAKEQLLVDGELLTFYPLERRATDLYVNNIRPCAFILNNDLSAGAPKILANCSQKIIPAINRGWHMRLKSTHYRAYDMIVALFCKQFAIDPWHLNSFFTFADAVDFSDPTSLESLVDIVTTILTKTAYKYKEYGIKEDPFVVVKADRGTYGMGVISVHDAEQILKLNRKQRKKMSVIKDGALLDRVLVQEGVPTIERWQQSYNMAESVLYLVNHFVIGGFYRVHAEKKPTENLNAPGMTFAPIPFEIPCQSPNWYTGLRDEHNKLYTYSVIARLAVLAASYEKNEVVHVDN